MNWTPPRPEAGIQLVPRPSRVPTALSYYPLPSFSPAPLSPSPYPFREHPHSLSRARPYARTIPRGFLSFALPFSLLLSHGPALLYLARSFSFPLSLPPSSGTVPLLPALSLSPSTVLSLSIFALFLPFSPGALGRPRSARIPTAVRSSLHVCLFLAPARAMPCSDCLTPTLHVRTTERPPVLFTGGAHDQPFLSFSLVPLRETARRRYILCQGLSGSLPPSPPPHVLPHPSFASWPAVPFRNISTSTRMYILAPDFSEFSTAEVARRPIPGTCSTLPLVPFFLDQTGRETIDTGDLFIILASKQAAREKGCYSLFFPLWTVGFALRRRDGIGKEISVEWSWARAIFAVYRCRMKDSKFPSTSQLSFANASNAIRYLRDCCCRIVSLTAIVGQIRILK